MYQRDGRGQGVGGQDRETLLSGGQAGAGGVISKGKPAKGEDRGAIWSLMRQEGTLSTRSLNAVAGLWTIGRRWEASL
jgi:hypothetical protein